MVLWIECGLQQWDGQGLKDEGEKDEGLIYNSFNIDAGGGCC